jgi:hypothetical protein
VFYYQFSKIMALADPAPSVSGSSWQEHSCVRGSFPDIFSSHSLLPRDPVMLTGVVECNRPEADTGDSRQEAKVPAYLHFRDCEIQWGQELSGQWGEVELRAGHMHGLI